MAKEPRGVGRYSRAEIQMTRVFGSFIFVARCLRSQKVINGREFVVMWSRAVGQKLGVVESRF